MKSILKLSLIALLGIFFLSNNVKAQNYHSLTLETGLLATAGSTGNTVMNISQSWDPVFFMMGYQFESSKLYQSVRLGFLTDHFAEEQMVNRNPSSNFYNLDPSSTVNEMNSLVLDYRVTFKWLQQKSNFLPLIDAGISTLIALDRIGDFTGEMGGSTINGVHNNNRIISDVSYKRRFNPLVTLGIQYKIFGNSKSNISIPIRFGYRIPVLSDYQTVKWTVMDLDNNTTTYEVGKKSGFASYFTIGLDIKL